MAITRIAVGVDGSDGSERALSWAAELAKALDAHVLAVHIVPESWLLELNAIQLRTDALVADRRTKLLGEWTEVLRDQGVAYSTELVQGHVSTELGRKAQELHADLIVVGGRHTAHRVAVHCALPVVVVPAPVEGEPEVPIPGQAPSSRAQLPSFISWFGAAGSHGLVPSVAWTRHERSTSSGGSTAPS